MGSKSRKTSTVTNLNETFNLVTAEDSQANNLVGDGNTLKIERVDVALAGDIIQAGTEQNIRINDNLNQLNADFLNTVDRQNETFTLAGLELNKQANAIARDAIAAANASASRTQAALGAANDNITVLAGDSIGRFSELATDSVAALESGSYAAINVANASAQRTVDAVLQASESETQQLTDTTIKLVVGATVATAAMPVLAKLLTRVIK